MSRGRTVAGALHRLLQAATQPIYVLDDSRQIVFGNAALLDWLGVDASQLIGQRCDYQALPIGEVQSAAAALCPPPEVFSSPRATFVVSIAGSDGKPISRRAECLPLAVGADESG